MKSLVLICVWIVAFWPRQSFRSITVYIILRSAPIADWTPLWSMGLSEFIACIEYVLAIRSVCNVLLCFSWK